MTDNAKRLARYLRRSGIPAEASCTSEPELEDDEVRIDGNLHVQVNSMTVALVASVVCRSQSGYVTFYPLRGTMRDILADIRQAKEALAEEDRKAAAARAAEDRRHMDCLGRPR